MPEQEQVKDKTQERVKEIAEAEEAIRKLATVIGSASERARVEEELKGRLTEATDALEQARQSVESAKLSLSGVEDLLKAKIAELGNSVLSVTEHLAGLQGDVQKQIEEGRLQTENRISNLKEAVQKLLESTHHQLENKMSDQLAASVGDIKSSVEQVSAQLGLAETKIQKSFFRVTTLIRWVLMVATVAGLLGAALTQMFLLK